MTQKPVKLERIVQTEKKLIERCEGCPSYSILCLVKHYEAQRQAIYRKWEQRRQLERYGVKND